MSELLDNLNEIELQKASFIIPKNLKKNVSALGVTGTLEYLDTTDATAQAKDIKEGQTAYVNDVKITGNLQYEPSDFSLNGITGDPVSTELKTSGNNKYIQLKYKRSGADTIVGGSANITANLQQETMAVAANITADKIKKGVEVLGVTGTYEGSGGSGDVKLFDTVEQMQQDTTAQEGDLAVVYREELTGITEESEFDSCTFPDKVVLDEAFTDYIYGGFSAVDSSSGYFDGMVEMSSSSFIFSGSCDTGVQVQYTSSDGITYTRTDGGEELVEFGTAIKWESYGEPFNNVIGNFMKIDGNYFNGLYEYVSRSDDYFTFGNFTSISGKFYPDYVAQVAEPRKKIMDILTPYLNENGYTLTYLTLVRKSTTEFVAYCSTTSNAPKALLDSSFIWFNNKTYISPNGYSGESVSYKIDINTETQQCLISPITATNSVTVGGVNRKYFEEITDYTFGMWFHPQRSFLVAYDNGGSGTTTSRPVSDLSIFKYRLAPTQLDTVSDYVYEKTFYGEKGVEVGSLGVPDDSLIDVNAKVYRDIAKTYDSMPVMIINDSNKSTFNLNKIYVTPIKFDGTPLLDTGNVTNFRNMFLNNTNLVAVTNLNTINSTNMEHLFRGCNNLSYVCNISTSNVKSFKGMFYDCANIVDVPKFNTSNATCITWMFYECTSLENLPYYDFSKVDSSTKAFAGCTNLKNISVYNFSNILTSDGWGMFQNCPNLTNAGLNNAMASLATIVHFQRSTHKTLEWAGLSEIQANVCTNLSNWAPLASNGWTTGY